jgi:hypothetical protein
LSEKEPGWAARALREAESGEGRLGEATKLPTRAEPNPAEGEPEAEPEGGPYGSRMGELSILLEGELTEADRADLMGTGEDSEPDKSSRWS